MWRLPVYHGHQYFGCSDLGRGNVKQVLIQYDQVSKLANFDRADGTRMPCLSLWEDCTGLSNKKGPELIPKVSPQNEQADEKHAIRTQVYIKPLRGSFRQPFRCISHYIGRQNGQDE